MKAPGWIAGGILLAGGMGVAWWLLGARDVETEEVTGEVRGASLRSAVVSAPPRTRSEDLAGPDSAAPPPAAAARPPAEDYADLLPPGEAAKYPWIDFDLLAGFDYPAASAGAEGAPSELPGEVRELDGTLIAIEGFMNPLAFDAGGVSEFTLVADPTFCCFGATPKLNHFVHVSLPEGERCDFHSMVPIAVFGELRVGAVEEDGFVLSVYRMEARHVLSAY